MRAKSWAQITDGLRKIHEKERELAHQSDRGLAIVGGAIVQDALKGLLLRSFVRSSGKIRGMFEPDGALSAFASQIRLAYALGLVSPAIYNDLELIRQIRNKAAHFIHFSQKDSEPEELVTFQNPAIRQWSLTLTCPSAVGFKSKDSRERFKKTCEWLTDRLRFPMDDSRELEYDDIPF